ncbi:hypothetical protein F5B19DRAFT_490512 [Rostrohypoxylon terebratum]|nr:hypothetical protein F5B19DRAFT_490512 [Rostrohypoxylon terebratum]
MSLNGLEDAKVVEAHTAAATEPGGWFLLKYANRDEVELLDRGNGGIVDIRGAIAKYEETSPLFGFLRYRRRNVILKYEPEECSRLVKARAAVHFNAVCERFSPYDTTFEISIAKDLKDSKLSAACSLHAASGSASSSSSSLRRRRLNEIAEEEEEEERERKRQSTVKEEDRRASSIYSTHARPTSPERPAVLDRKQISDPQATNFASTSNVPEFTGAERPTSKAESAPRLSSQSTRPELYNHSSHSYGKPKVKLGPRPSLDVNRPSTAGNFRPIAALPAGFKLFSKGSKKGQSQESEHADKVEDMAPITPKRSVPIPEVPQGETSQLPPRPATSSGASLKSTSHSLAPTTKEVKMTPEKARLMKAMKLREKKKMMSSITAEQTEVTDKSVDKQEEDTGAKPSLRIKDAGHRTVSHADSGITIDPPTPMTINTEDTSDSHPNSPTAATSSEIGASTKASSLSESTDETVQAKKDTGEDVEPTTLQEADNNILGSEHATENTQDKESRVVTQEADVSDMRNVESEESSRIPEFDKPLLELKRPTIQESIEVDEPTELPLSTHGKDTRQSPNEEDAPKSPWGLPVSKFSSNEARSPTSPTANSLKSKFSIPEISLPTDSVPDLPSHSEVISTKSEERNGIDSFPNARTEPVLPVEKDARRKTSVGPIRTDLSKTTPRSEVSDPLLDDDLMDELQSATVQEAKPISVSKSPITPVFPNNPLQAPKLARTVSNPMRGPLLAPSDVTQVSARSVSAGGAAFLHSITRQSSNAGLQSKKNNIGSSISQRIKALEKLSSSGPVEESRPRTATPSTTFFHARRQSKQEPSRSQSVAERADSLTRHAPTPDRSREVTPETPGRERSLSVASRLSMFEPISSSRGRPESIQVTARIIRDPSQSLLRRAETNKSLGDFPQTELKQSPLVVDLQRAETQPVPKPEPTPLATPPKETIQERRDKSADDGEKKKRRRSSLSIVKEFMKDRRASIVSKSTDNLSTLSPNDAKSPSRPPSAHQNSGGFVRRLSISSRRSSISRDRDNSASSPMGSPGVLSDSGSETDKKSKNRASRFMRRLSNSFNSNRKNTSPHISPTVTEEDADQVAAVAAAATAATTAATTTTAATAVSTTDVSTSSQPAVVAYMGDVNVQFPDNLLWKRRSMCLDSQGFLFLSAVQGVATAGKDKAGLKRYHMSDFRAPCIPDVEIQELPNSVVLDLVEGSCLQIACEDRAGQLNVLHALQDAHKSHSSFGQ